MLLRVLQHTGGGPFTAKDYLALRVSIARVENPALPTALIYFLLFICCCCFKRFYLLEREHKQGERQREKQALP